MDNCFVTKTATHGKRRIIPLLLLAFAGYV